MSDIPNISEEYNYFEKLFENAEKEQVGDLYKKELYIMKEDLDANKSKTTLKIMHDTILQKFMCEEYTDFIPKNEVAQLIYPPEKKEANPTNNKNSQKDDAVDKELLEEYEYLKELYRLNYLTFSPFALEYFEKISDPKKFESKNNINKNNNNEKDSTINNNNNKSINNNINNSINNNNINNSVNSNKGNIPNINNNIKEEMNEEQKEKDNKLLKLLNFDYNSFELNNDLLFNISQGFIDLSKLKENNLKYNEKKDNKDNSDSYDSSKNDEFDVYEYDEELNQNLIDKTMKFVKSFEKNLLLKRAIVRFKDELSKLSPKCKNKAKNEFYRVWDQEFMKLEKDNERLVRRREEEEKKQQLIKQKMYLDRLKKEKEDEEEKKIDKDYEFINELKKIQFKAMKNSGGKDNKVQKKEIVKKKKKNVNKSVSIPKKNINKNNKKFYCSGFNIYKEMIGNRQRSAKH